MVGLFDDVDNIPHGDEQATKQIEVYHQNKQEQATHRGNSQFGTAFVTL